MTTSVHSHKCEYLQTPHIFTSERAELVHITEQISLLDSHISELQSLRDNLHRRSRDLRDLLSPVRKLPTEILSYIFQLVVLPEIYVCEPNPLFHVHFPRLVTSLNLVSSLFRRVALGTPELWKRISIHITNEKRIKHVSSLFQQRIALAPSIHIAVWDLCDREEKVQRAIDIVLGSDVARKVKTLELYKSYAPDLWTEKLTRSSFPMLDTLTLSYLYDQDPCYDFGSLNTLARLSILTGCLHQPVILPSSLQYVHINHSAHQVLVSVFYQCPNLVEADFRANFTTFEDSDGDTQFPEPLTLNYLKQLTCCIFNAPEAGSLSQSLQLPALETLQLRHSSQSKFIKFIPLCRNVSGSLTTLIIISSAWEQDYDEIYRLCKLSFPKLRKLELRADYLPPFLSAIHALALVEREYNKAEGDHLPELTSITLRYKDDIKPHRLLDSLRESRIGNAFHYHIQVDYGWYNRYRWSPELREEMKAIVGGRRIEVTWGKGGIGGRIGGQIIMQ